MRFRKTSLQHLAKVPLRKRQLLSRWTSQRQEATAPCSGVRSVSSNFQARMSFMTVRLRTGDLCFISTQRTPSRSPSGVSVRTFCRSHRSGSERIRAASIAAACATGSAMHATCQSRSTTTRAVCSALEAVPSRLIENAMHACVSGELSREPEQSNEKPACDCIVDSSHPAEAYTSPRGHHRTDGQESNNSA